MIWLRSAALLALVAAVVVRSVSCVTLSSSPMEEEANDSTDAQLRRRMRRSTTNDSTVRLPMTTIRRELEDEAAKDELDSEFGEAEGAEEEFEEEEEGKDEEEQKDEAEQKEEEKEQGDGRVPSPPPSTEQRNDEKDSGASLGMGSNTQKAPTVENHHPPLFPLSAGDVIGFLFCILALMLAAGGGIGVGGILVPLYILVWRFHAKYAIPLANVTVFGGAVANTMLNVQKRHPLADRPLIDWDLILVMEPLTMAGALVGANLNKWLSETLIVFMLVVLLSIMAYTTLVKAYKMHVTETYDIVATLTSGMEDGSASRRPSSIFGVFRHNSSGISEEDVRRDRDMLKGDTDAVTIEVELTPTTASQTGNDERGGANVGEEEAVDLPESHDLGTSLVSTVSIVFDDPHQTSSDNSAALFPQENGGGHGGGGEEEERNEDKDDERPRDKLNGHGHSEFSENLQISFLVDEDSVVEDYGGDQTIPVVEEDKGVPIRNPSLTTPLPFDASPDGCSPEVVKVLVEQERYPSVRSVAVIVILFFTILLVNILKGGGSFSSPLGIDCGKGPFWMAEVGMFGILLGVASYARSYVMKRSRLKRELDFPFVEGDIEWTSRTTVQYPAICALAGFVAGLFGVGSGIIKGPLMVAVMHVHPAVAAATSACMILFTSFTATTSFIVFGFVQTDYALLCLVVGFLATGAGQLLMTFLLERYRRNSLIVFSIGLVVLLSAFLMAIASVVSLVRHGARATTGLCTTHLDQQ